MPECSFIMRSTGNWKRKCTASGALAVAFGWIVMDLDCDSIEPGFSRRRLRLRRFLLSQGFAGKRKKLVLVGRQIALQQESYLLEELFVRHRKHSSFGGGCWLLDIGSAANWSEGFYLILVPVKRKYSVNIVAPASGRRLAASFLQAVHSSQAALQRFLGACPAYQLPFSPSVTEAGNAGFRTVFYGVRIQSSKRIQRWGRENCVLYCG